MLTCTVALRSATDRTSTRASTRPRVTSRPIRSRSAASLPRSSSPIRSWRSRKRWLTARRLTVIPCRAFSPDASP